MKDKRKTKKQKKPLVLTERDRAIILSVYENRFLRRDQIQRLFFSKSSLPACNMRLKKLYEHRFLDRLYKPVAVGSSQAVYALDKRGAEIVALILGRPINQINWKRDHNRVEFLFLEHTLAVSEFKVNLDLALARSDVADLIFYRRGTKSLNTRVSDPRGKKKYLVVAPDAFFGIKNHKGRSYFFLEADLGTETLKRFQEKTIAYKEYWKTGKYTQTYGFKNFRVLTITESRKRLENLMEATRKVGGKNMFLFSILDSSQKPPFVQIWQSPVENSYLNIF